MEYVDLTGTKNEKHRFFRALILGFTWRIKFQFVLALCLVEKTCNFISFTLSSTA